MAETQGAHLTERSSLREEDHPNRPEMTKTAGTTVGLEEMTLAAGKTLPERPKEEGT